MTDFVDVVQFPGAVERAELGGKGDIDESWMYGMVFVAVVHIVIKVFVEYLGFQFTIGVGQSDDLVLSELHGTGLMNVDMAAAHADDTLILVEHRVDGRGIGLGAAREEENLGIGQTASLTDKVLGLLREFVEAIGCRLRIVMPDEVVNHLLTGTVVIVTFERDHT